MSLEIVFRESDIVTANYPISPVTRSLVNAERLALMKPSAHLLNGARGLAMIDELFADFETLDINAVHDVLHGREPQGIAQRRVTENAEWLRRLDDSRARFSDPC